MTREKWAKMPRHVQELYLAVLLGYTSVEAGTADCPHFCTDLNTMQEVLLLLGEQRLAERGYWDNLWKALKSDEDDSASDEWYLHRATAAQRAEALALTLEPEE